MALNNTYALGRNVRASVKQETTFGTVAAPGFAAGDSFQVLGGVSVEPAEDRKIRADARQTRSSVEMIVGNRANSATVRTYILPPTTSTNTPDIAPLLIAALGVEDTSTATTPTYECSAAQNVPPPVSALFEYNGEKSDLLTGWVIEEMRISVPNGDEPTFEFTGPCKQQIHCGTSEASAALAGDGIVTSSTVTLESASAPNDQQTLGAIRNFEVGSYVSVGDRTNLYISAIDYASHSFTVQNGSNPGVDTIAAGATGVAIVPYTPYAEASLEASTLISSINGSVTVGGSAATLQSLEVTVKNNWAEIRPILSNGLVADFCPGFREVTGTVTFWVRDTDVLRAMSRPRFEGVSGVNPTPIVVTLGGANSGDGQCVINIPAAHLELAAAEIPESETASVQVPFTALASTLTAEDEINIVYSITP